MKRRYRRREEIGGASEGLFHAWRYIQTREEVTRGHLKFVLKHLKDCHVEEGVVFFFVELEPQMQQ